MIGELREKLGKLWGDLDGQLFQLRTLISDQQKQLHDDLQKLRAQSIAMQRDWGNDVTHLLHVNEQNANTIDMRLADMKKVNDEVHARLQNDLNEMQTRQTVLVRTVAAMEEHLAQSPYDEKEQETGTPQLPSGPRIDDSLTHLPDDLMGETGTDREQP